MGTAINILKLELDRNIEQAKYYKDIERWNIAKEYVKRKIDIQKAINILKTSDKIDSDLKL